VSLYRAALGAIAKDRARANVRGLFGSSCIVRRKTGSVSNGRGASTPTYADDPPVACQVTYVSGLTGQSGSEQAFLERYRGRALGTIYLHLPEGQSVGTDDLITVVGDVDHEVAGPAFQSTDGLALAVPVVKNKAGGNPLA
jgi:hypothetical protein